MLTAREPSLRLALFYKAVKPSGKSEIRTLLQVSGSSESSTSYGRFNN